jgi:hypothetical protein
MLVYEVDRRHLFRMGPDCAISEAGWKLESETLMEMRQIVLKEPGLLGEVGMAALLVLECDDSARVAAWGFGDADFVVLEHMGIAITVLDHLVVLDGILVAVGADAPDVHGEDFRVFVEGDADDSVSPALRTENLHDLAVMLDRTAVGSDGVGGVFEKNDGVGLRRVAGKLLLGGGADPIGNAIRPGGECRSYGEAEEENQG